MVIKLCGYGTRVSSCINGNVALATVTIVWLMRMSMIDGVYIRIDVRVRVRIIIYHI